MQAAVTAGTFANGAAHYLSNGIAENRDPCPLYNESYYLAMNPDIQTVVTAGTYRAGLEHLMLFGQAEGRDLWQTPLLLWHMIGGALAVGGGASLMVALGYQDLEPAIPVFSWVMLIGAAMVGLVALAELLGSHPTTNARAGFHHMTKGEFATEWWRGQLLAVVVPILAAILILTGGSSLTGVAGALAAMAGIFLADDAFVKAGQSVPLS